MLKLYMDPVVGYSGWPMTKESGADEMNPHEWTWRCTERLHEQWPRVDPGDLVNVAEALHHGDRWKGMKRQDAAEQWLRHGIPTSPVDFTAGLPPPARMSNMV